MTSNSPTSTDLTTQTGMLRVEVPHWATHVRVFDSRGRVVRQADQMPLDKTETDASEPIWCACTPLAFGAYEAEVAVDGSAARQLSLRDGPDTARYTNWYKMGVTVRQLAVIYSPEGCLLTKLSWEEPIKQQLEKLTTQQAETAGKRSAKATYSVDTAAVRDVQLKAAQAWSRTITSTKTAGNSELFLFVRALTPEKQTRFFDNLALFDAHEKLITTFPEGAEVNKEAGWMAFNASLPAGFYRLKRLRYGASPTWYQGLYLCEGWQTQVFMEAKQRPSLRTLSLNMARLGAGFRTDDDSTLAAAIMLNSLKRSTDPNQFATIAAITKLLGGTIENPWLAILIAYTIRLQQDQLLPDDDSPSDLWPQMLTLLPELLALLTTIREHPDVQALQLDKNERAQTPINYPPLLFAGLRRVQQHALKFAGTIAPNSVLERLLPRIATSTAWTAWRPAVQLTTPRQQAPKRSPESDAGSEKSLSDPSTENFLVTSTSPDYLRAVSPKLPIYQVQMASWSADRALTAVATEANAQPALPSASETFWNATALQAAQQLALFNPDATRNVVSFDPDAALPPTQPINATDSINSLLNLNADRIGEISQASGVPLAQVQSSLKKLRHSNQQPAKTAKNLSPYDRTVFGYALQKAIDSNASDPLLITIEECVNKLLTEVQRLSLRLAQSTLWQAVKPLAERISGLADQLLFAAKFVALTDTEGAIRLSNGVFVTLLNRKSQVNQDTLQRWEAFFKTAPFGQSNLPSTLMQTSIVGEWILHRTVLHDDALNQSIYINIFYDSRGLVLTPELLKEFELCLPRLALPASSLAYSKPPKTDQIDKEAAQQIRKLDEVVSQMEELLKKAGGGS